MAKAKGAGPTVPKVSGKAKGRTANPKLKGGDSKRTQVKSGMNVGGNTDAKVRTNQWAVGSMLQKQLKKNKSTGLKK